MLGFGSVKRRLSSGTQKMGGCGGPLLRLALSLGSADGEDGDDDDEEEEEEEDDDEDEEATAAIGSRLVAEEDESRDREDRVDDAHSNDENNSIEGLRRMRSQKEEVWAAYGCVLFFKQSQGELGIRIIICAIKSVPRYPPPPPKA